jgi:hypothetical protein
MSTILGGFVGDSSMAKISENRRIRTTVRLPRPLYEQARKFVERDLVPADNINDFFVAAISAYVKLLERKEIDSRFARIADDTDFQKEAKLIAEEFRQSDWEAFELAERESAQV